MKKEIEVFATEIPDYGNPNKPPIYVVEEVTSVDGKVVNIYLRYGHCKDYISKRR